MAESDINPDNQTTPPSTNPEPPSSPDVLGVPPTPPIVSSPHPKRGSPGLLAVIIILVLAAFAGGAWLVTRQFSKTKPVPAEVKNDIPLLRYGASEGPINVFYPGTGLINGEYDVNQQIFEGLVRYENQTRIVPLLATSWTNPDASTWVFALKPNVKFHTGRIMKAQDVKASIEYVKSNNADLGATFAGTIKSVEVVDDSHVKIITDGPDPVLLNKLTFLYVFDTTTEKKEDPANGTGPYQLKTGSTPSEQGVDLMAFDGYHGGHVSLREVQIVYYEDEAKLADDLKSGKLNMGGPTTQTKNVQKLADLQQIKFKSSSVNHIGINTLKTKSPVSKLKVRQAIYFATDPDAYIKARGVEAEPVGQIVSPDIPGYNPAIKRPVHDIAKAKQLLAEAGYPNGTTLTLGVVSGDNAGEELARQLKEAGITVKLESYDDLGQLADKIFSGDVEIYVIAYSTDVLDAIDVFNTFFYKSPVYDNPKVTTLIDEANQTTDQAKRLKTLQQISQLVMEDVAWVPMSSNQLTLAFDKPYIFQRDVPGAGLGVYFWRLYTK